jgi:hypothetical protein
MADLEPVDDPREPLREFVERAVAAMRAGEPDGARRTEKMLRATRFEPEELDTSWDEVESHVNFELSWLAASVSAGYVGRAVELATELHQRGLGTEHVGMTERELAAYVKRALDGLVERLDDPAAGGENGWLLMDELHAACEAQVALPGLESLRDESRAFVRAHYEWLLREARSGNRKCAAELWSRVLWYGDSAGVSQATLGITDEEWSYFSEAIDEHEHESP